MISPKHWGRYILVDDIYYFSKAVFLPGSHEWQAIRDCVDLLGKVSEMISVAAWVWETIAVCSYQNITPNGAIMDCLHSLTYSKNTMNGASSSRNMYSSSAICMRLRIMAEVSELHF